MLPFVKSCENIPKSLEVIARSWQMDGWTDEQMFNGRTDKRSWVKLNIPSTILRTAES